MAYKLQKQTLTVMTVIVVVPYQIIQQTSLEQERILLSLSSIAALGKISV